MQNWSTCNLKNEIWINHETLNLNWQEVWEDEKSPFPIIYSNSAISASRLQHEPFHWRAEQEVRKKLIINSNVNSKSPSWSHKLSHLSNICVPSCTLLLVLLALLSASHPNRLKQELYFERFPNRLVEKPNRMFSWGAPTNSQIRTTSTSSGQSQSQEELKLQFSIEKEKISARAVRKESLSAITVAARQRKRLLWCLWRTGGSGCADIALQLQPPSYLWC